MIRNLDYYLRLNPNTSDQSTYLSLIQPNISGGRIEKQQIDTIKLFPNVTEISISGLKQDTFDYFIENYGQQFKAIIFWKCPLVGDLSKIESLEKVEYIVYFWNQRTESLWDFSKTISLKGFSYDDFTRMHDIYEISKSPSIEELHFGDRVWDKYILKSLAPMKELSLLKKFSFSAKKILDGKIEPIAALKNLESLSFPANLFLTEQVAWLKAHLPNSVVSRELNAYRVIKKPTPLNGTSKDTLVIGKRKPFLSSGQDKAKITKYIDQFNTMHRWFLENPKALPEEYKEAAKA